jgi:murein DD-endopeptidase MepM/ murein hydrolase activator NlpD
MFRLTNIFGLSHIPSYTATILLKIVLGGFFITFFLNYQPVLGFPPLKPTTTIHAQNNTQIEAITSDQTLVFQLPHPGYLSTPYSSWHPGIDIATGLGMPIHPIAKGKVVDAGFNFWGLGLTVEVVHPNGMHSVYAHMGKIYVKKDQEVDANSFIGEVGLTGHTTGPHTHLEISKDGKSIEPATILPNLRDYPKEEDFANYAATPSAELKKS